MQFSLFRKIISLLVLTSVAAASPETNQILKGLKASNDPIYRENIQIFSDNLAEYCGEWTPAAFQNSKTLTASCSFPVLYKIYQERVGALADKNESGLELSEIRELGLNSDNSILQAGAWQAVPFAKVDGPQTATEIIASRIGLEKALEAHANYIHGLHRNTFSTFASYNVPRMIASFAGYSLAVRILKYVNSFECGDPDSTRTIACRDSQDFLQAAQQQALSSIGDFSLLTQLDNLSVDNSSRSSLKTKKVTAIAGLIVTLKQEASAEQILESIQGRRKHPAYENLEKALYALAEESTELAKTDYQRMLVAVSILAELQFLQDQSKTISVSPVLESAGLGAEVATEVEKEVYQLKAWIAKALLEEEQVR
jgi:hypothetical protein